MQRIPSILVCFTTQGVIQNGSVFRYQTHTSGHFFYILESPPPPPPGEMLQIHDCIHATTKGVSNVSRPPPPANKKRGGMVMQQSRGALCFSNKNRILFVSKFNYSYLVIA